MYALLRVVVELNKKRSDRYTASRCRNEAMSLRKTLMKLPDPRTFWPVVTVVAVVIAPSFMAIIIATWSGGRGGRSSAELLGTWSTWSVVDVVRAQ